MQANQKSAGRIKTVWEVRTYDVWGNAKDGYEVNDSFSQGEITLYAAVTRYNVGTDREFKAAALSNKQIREALDIKPRYSLHIDGDDLTYYVNAGKDDYPVGELRCISHESLSPIRKTKEDKAA